MKEEPRKGLFLYLLSSWYVSCKLQSPRQIQSKRKNKNIQWSQGSPIILSSVAGLRSCCSSEGERLHSCPISASRPLPPASSTFRARAASQRFCSSLRRSWRGGAICSWRIPTPKPSTRRRRRRWTIVGDPCGPGRRINCARSARPSSIVSMTERCPRASGSSVARIPTCRKGFSGANRASCLSTMSRMVSLPYQNAGDSKGFPVFFASSPEVASFLQVANTKPQDKE